MINLKQLLKQPKKESLELNFDTNEDENRFLLQHLFLYSKMDDVASFDKLLTKKLRFLEPFCFDKELVKDGSPSSNDGSFNIELDPCQYFTFLDFASKTMPTRYFSKIVDLAMQESLEPLFHLSSYGVKNCIEDLVVNSIKNHDYTITEKIIRLFNIPDKLFMQIILLDRREELKPHIDESILKNPYILLETLASSNYKVIESRRTHLYGSQDKDVSYVKNMNTLFKKYEDPYAIKIQKNIVDAVSSIEPDKIKPGTELRIMLKESLVKLILENAKYSIFPAKSEDFLISESQMDLHLSAIRLEFETILKSNSKSQYSYSNEQNIIRTYSIITDLIENHVFSLEDRFTYQIHNGKTFDIPIKDILVIKYKNNPEKMKELEVKEKANQLNELLPENNNNQKKLKI